MFTYTYSRDLVNNLYNIDNPLRVDVNDNQIYLIVEVQNSLASVDCLKATNTNCDIMFSTELSESEKTTLDTIVNNHKNNT